MSGFNWDRVRQRQRIERYGAELTRDVESERARRLRNAKKKAKKSRTAQRPVATPVITAVRKPTKPQPVAPVGPIIVKGGARLVAHAERRGSTGARPTAPGARPPMFVTCNGCGKLVPAKRMGKHLKLVHNQRAGAPVARRPDLTPCADCGALVKNLERHRSKVHLRNSAPSASAAVASVSPAPPAITGVRHAAQSRRSGTCPRCGKIFKDVAAHYLAKHPQEFPSIPVSVKGAPGDNLRPSLTVAARLQEQIHRDFARVASGTTTSDGQPLRFDTFTGQLPRSERRVSGRCWKCGAPIFVETGACSRPDCTANASE